MAEPIWKRGDNHVRKDSEEVSQWVNGASK
jgi:hypothetical protein